jgi:hypothetical protein
MAAQGNSITRQSVYDEFLSRIWTTASNTIVYSATSNPGTTRIQTAQLGSGTFTTPPGGVTSIDGNTLVTASSIMTVAKNYAAQSTAARRARSGFIVDNFSPDTAETTTDDRTDVCRLTDAYIIAYTYTGSLSGVISATNMQAYFDALRSTASAAQTSATVVDLRVCHSSCHNSCHGSRGRR